MKLITKEPNSSSDESFYINESILPCLDDSWHFHSQFELILVIKSSGTRFVGDNVSKFLPGDLVLVGPNLPHLWRNNPTYYKSDSDKSVRTVVIKFEPSFLGEKFFNLSEMKVISELLNKSKFGVHFGSTTSKVISKEIVSILSLDGPSKLFKLLTILDELSKSKDISLLSKSDMIQLFTDKKKRWDNIIKFMSDNYSNDITLEDAAKIACMTTNSFCRYFKLITNKSFSYYLNEIRVSNAKRMLIQYNLNISDICYDVGYRSLTNFNKQFKRLTGITPLEFRKNLEIH